MITEWVSEQFFWVFLALIFLNLMQRRHQKRAGPKRMASLYLAVAAFLLMVSAQMIVMYELPNRLFAVPVVLIAAVLYRWRERTFPFRLYSPKSGRRFTWEEILYRDDPDDQPDDPDDQPDDPDQ